MQHVQMLMEVTTVNATVVSLVVDMCVKVNINFSNKEPHLTCKKYIAKLIVMHEVYNTLWIRVTFRGAF